MRMYAALLLLSCACAPAAAQEPFGVRLSPFPQLWETTLKDQFIGPDRELVVTIAREVRKQPREYWLTWVNKLSTLAQAPGCAPRAVLKHEVLHELGVAAADMRFVIGNTQKPPSKHVVLAVREGDTWRFLDSGRFKSDHRVLSEDEVPDFKPRYTLY